MRKVACRVEEHLDHEEAITGEHVPATPTELLARLATLGIDAPTVSHAPVFTVEQAQALKGDLAGAHTKNLFVRDKKGVMWLIVAMASQPVDLKALSELLGLKRFSFGSPKRLMRYLGVQPGSVTPFAVVNDYGGLVSVALDTSLRDHAVWNFHPLVNSMTTSIGAEDMLRFLDAVDHPPRWVSLVRESHAEEKTT
jgi:Ala-tRNA(Pro) deacylase